jgi:uncharacterized protein (TIGR03437 family)
MKTNSILLLLSVIAIPFAQAQPPGGGPPTGGAGGSGDGIWRRNAAFGEALTFDACEGHQPNSGDYHYHVNPVCLRAFLGDNLTLVKTTRVGSVYQENSTGLKHSPILGWALDGYPIYGPYGYSDPKNPSSAIKRMASSFQLRSITTRTSLPSWSLANHSGISQTLTSSQYGPAVSAAYPLGRYVEDYDYIAGSGDLDQYNGRTTVTPDFPNGTYAYFITIDANGNPVFPYILAGSYYGTASGGEVKTVTGTVTDYFDNGSYVQTPVSTPILASWSTKNSTQFAQLVSPLDPAAGPETTWPGTLPTGIAVSGSVTSPAYADIQRIRYSSTAVYINANALPSYVFGPWFGFTDNGGVFANFPDAENYTAQFPTSPAPATTFTSTALGAAGLWVNGVEVFNFLDGASYSNSAGADEGGGGVGAGVLNVSGASFEGGPSAPNSIVTGTPVFQAVIASSTASASSANWPTTLGGATVSVKDSAGTSRAAQMSYASPSQINYVVPNGTATGAATVTVTVGGTAVTGALNVVATYPNLFSLNGAGLAAAYVEYANGQIALPYQTLNGAIVAQPVSAGTAANPAYLVLVGSGLGTASGATSQMVSATIGGIAATVAYAGAQGTYPGVDQYNIIIPPSLAGKGSVNVVVTAAGLPSNTVNITLQ